MKLAEAIIHIRHLKQEIDALINNAVLMKESTSSYYKEIEILGQELEKLQVSVAKTREYIKIGNSTLAAIQIKYELMRNILEVYSTKGFPLLDEYGKCYRKTANNLEISLEQINWTVDLVDG